MEFIWHIFYLVAFLSNAYLAGKYIEEKSYGKFFLNLAISAYFFMLLIFHVVDIEIFNEINNHIYVPGGGTE